MMLNTRYQGSTPCGFRKEDFFMFSLYKLLWLTLLPARMKKILSKLKTLERSQHFSHYKSMGIFKILKGR